MKYEVEIRVREVCGKKKATIFHESCIYRNIASLFNGIYVSWLFIKRLGKFRRHLKGECE